MYQVIFYCDESPNVKMIVYRSLLNSLSILRKVGRGDVLIDCIRFSLGLIKQKIEEGLAKTCLFRFDHLVQILISLNHQETSAIPNH